MVLFHAGVAGLESIVRHGNQIERFNRQACQVVVFEDSAEQIPALTVASLAQLLELTSLLEPAWIILRNTRITLFGSWLDSVINALARSPNQGIIYADVPQRELDMRHPAPRYEDPRQLSNLGFETPERSALCALSTKLLIQLSDTTMCSEALQRGPAFFANWIKELGIPAENAPVLGNTSSPAISPGDETERNWLEESGASLQMDSGWLNVSSVSSPGAVQRADGRDLRAHVDSSGVDDRSGLCIVMDSSDVLAVPLVWMAIAEVMSYAKRNGFRTEVVILSRFNRWELGEYSLASNHIDVSTGVEEWEKYSHLKKARSGVVWILGDRVDTSDFRTILQHLPHFKVTLDLRFHPTKRLEQTNHAIGLPTDYWLQLEREVRQAQLAEFSHRIIVGEEQSAIALEQEYELSCEIVGIPPLNPALAVASTRTATVWQLWDGSMAEGLQACLGLRKALATRGSAAAQTHGDLLDEFKIAIFLRGFPGSAEGHWRASEELILDTLNVCVAPLNSREVPVQSALQSMAAGFPTIFTEDLSRQLGLNSDDHVLVAQNEYQLREHLISLSRSKSQREEVAHVGRHLASRLMPQRTVTEILSDDLCALDRGAHV